jgi:hypothetical protein
MATLKKMTRVGADVRQIARLLQAKAPENHLLAYITPEEAELLKSRGGSGMPDPQTGIPTYYVPEAEYADPRLLGYVESDFPYLEPLQNEGVGIYEPNASYGGELPSMNADSTYGGQPSYTLPSYGQGGYAGDISAGFDAASYAPRDMGAGGYGAGANVNIPAEVDYRDRVVADTKIDTTPSKTIGERYSDLAKSLGVKEDTLSRIGLAGLQVGLGARQARQAREESKKAKEEQQRLAAPYQQKGAELQRAAQAGELTPAGQQQLQTVQAQAAQAASARGGVGAQQTAARVEAIRSQLLQQQYDYGLKLSGIGDQILLGAIRTGLEADRYVNQLSNTYFTNVARTLAGSPTVIQYGVPA